MGYYSLPDGSKHAFLYDPAGNSTTAIDLHEAILLLGVAPDGWVSTSATDINDDGVIVGYLEPSVWDPNFRRGYRLDTRNWTISLLPDDDWSYSFPRRINEDGDIAGLYRNLDQTWGVYSIRALDTTVLLLGQNVQQNIHLNNSVEGRAAQVAGLLTDGTPFRWTTGAAGTLELISGIPSSSVAGINDSGTIGGSTYTKVLKGGSARYALRYSTTLEILPSANKAAVSINSAGDLAIQYFAEPSFLYHDSWGFLKLDDLIDLSDPDAPAWFSRNGTQLVGLSDRIATTTNGDAKTEFGRASGNIVLADGNAMHFLLTPVPNK